MPQVQKFADRFNNLVIPFQQMIQDLLLDEGCNAGINAGLILD